MIHKQATLPAHASTGDVWLDPKGSFKRVLSRGGAWENVNLGSKHPDEVDHEQGAQPEAEQRDESTEVSGGTGESAPGNGDDGETLSEPSGERGPEDTLLEGFQTGESGSTSEPSSPPSQPSTEAPPEGEGVDGNGSPVV